MDQPGSVHSVTVVLCSDCTLRCAYCYQRPGASSLRMSWTVLRAALDVALASPARPLTIEFSGGEPLLALPMVRRALRYIERSGRGAGVRYVLTTNGTLLDAAVLSLLEEHRFEVRLTFHAVPPAPDRGGRAVFQRLNGVLDLLQTEHAALWRDRLTVAVTVGIRELPTLADSVQYLVEKGVRHIGLSAAFGETGWQRRDIRAIERQFSRVTELMRRGRALSGWVPVTVYRHAAGAKNPSSCDDRWCSGALGRAIAIDPTGQAYGCVMLAGASATLTVDAGSPLSSFRLGDLRAPEFNSRLSTYPVVVRDAGIFQRRREQYSAYARCGECRFIGECSICPAAPAFEPRGTEDPNRVSDFVCAFNRVMFTERERFPAEPSAWDRLAGSAPVPALVRQLHQHAARQHRVTRKRLRCT